MAENLKVVSVPATGKPRVPLGEMGRGRDQNNDGCPRCGCKHVVQRQGTRVCRHCGGLRRG